MTKTTTVPGPRPCSIREDGHRAPATRSVASDAYGFVAGVPSSRLFCASCAEAEAELLTDFGFGAIVSELVVRELRPTRGRYIPQGFPLYDGEGNLTTWCGPRWPLYISEK